MEKYNHLAKDIIAHVGGKENIASLHHCVTRLRFQLLDESKADDQYLLDLEGVITIRKAMGQYMVVIGEHVPLVFEEVCKEIGMNTGEATSAPVEKKHKEGIGKRVLRLIMGAMMPILHLLCACGIIKGLTVIFVFTGLLQPADGLYTLLNGIGDSIFFFLPILLGYNLAKKLDMEPYLGLLIGASLCYPGLNGTDINLFGYVVNATYTGSFLPVLVIVCLAAPVERKLKKIIPSLVSAFFVPMLILLIFVPIGFALIGPVANLVGVGINSVVTYLLGINKVIAGALLGGIWQVLVLFGIHGVLLMFPFMELLQGHPTQMLAFVGAQAFSQIAVVLAIYLKTKDKKLKGIALPAFFSGLFGVTEPAIYGITLPRIKMFVITCIGSGIGGLIAGLTNIIAYSYTGMGVIGLIGLLNPEDPQMLPIAMLAIIPFLVSFALAYALFKDDPSIEVKEEEHKKLQGVHETILSPMKGMVKPLALSKDEAFSSGALGKGVIIEPSEGVVYAPFDGVVRTLFPTKHAIGIVSNQGCEVLVHIGIDTVRLQGEGFHACVNQGDHVRAGQTLITFEIDNIKEKGYDVTSPIIVTNSDQYLDIVEMKDLQVNKEQVLLTVIG